MSDGCVGPPTSVRYLAFLPPLTPTHSAKSNGRRTPLGPTPLPTRRIYYAQQRRAHRLHRYHDARHQCRTTVPPHVHHRFAETFDLLSGAISVFHLPSGGAHDLEALEASKQALEIGALQTVQPNRLHKYVVEGEEGAVLRVVCTPGMPDFERLLKIMNGLDADGRLAALGDSVVLMAVVMDLSDAHLVGPMGEMLAGVRAEKAEEIAALKKELLDKYDTEEALLALLGEGRVN
ncbi:putative cupin 2 conserved barrel domain protein [Mycena kentingensis (nom. inval.)]|nr:putative cupin 2 conserved barrel domain protein [Mycena kentingensis (nom. inval.)]